MVEFKFHIKMPIFVARQHMRHRMASVNEMSARYSIVPDTFFVPEEYRVQDTTNRQSSEGIFNSSYGLRGSVTEWCEHAFEIYDKAIESGCCRELARCHLPQSTYTEFYWKINLHNLLHYLQLRMEPGAQQEIRDYANAICSIIEPMLPLTMKAFKDFRVGGLTLSGCELALFRPDLTEQEVRDSSLSVGEKREFIEKLKKMGIIR